MHITFVLQHHPANLAGGAQKQAWLTAEYLSRMGWQVSFVANELPKKEAPGPTITLPSRGYYLSLINGSNLRRALRRLNPDVVYHRVSGPYTLHVARAAHAVGAKCVWAVATLRECDGHKFRSKARGRDLKSKIRWLLDWFMDFTINRAAKDFDLVLCQGETQAELFNTHLASPWVTVLRSSIPRLENPPEPGPRDSILWVGSPNRYKRPELIFDMAQRMPHQTFRMAGIKDVDQLGLKQAPAIPANLTLLGRLSNADLFQEYARAKILMLTSKTEGFPNVFLEAWQHQCPVLSLWPDPDDLAVREGAGWFAHDVVEAVAMLENLDEPTLRKAGERGRDLVLRTFDAEKNAAKLADYLHKLLEKGTP